MTDPVEEDDLEIALAAEVPEIYVNSFANYLSDGDIVTVLQRNGRPVAMMNMSLPVAKVYAKFVLDLVSNHEQVVGYTLKLPSVTEPEDGRGD